MLSRLSRSPLRRALLRSLVALLVIGIACGDDPIAPVCSGPVDVRVSGSLPPVISWTPDCSVERLTAMTPPSMGFVQAWVITAGDRRIESGVRLGQVPSGAVEESSLGFVASGTTLGILVESPRGTILGTASWVAP